MQPTLRTVSIALVTGIALSQFASTVSVQAQPRQNISSISESSKASRENSATIAAMNSKESSRINALPESKICNHTQNTIHYSVNGANASLPSTYCVTWELTEQALLLSFDRLYSSGFQGQTYELTKGSFAFRSFRWSDQPDKATSVEGVNLFKSKASS